ncbi:MAG: undecaprenyldiphospho-muramoylpentapeptide beta-N-acetylglucosaminyltransferase [Pisciglobus halotolerans]|nr:undecaprenyldiphospho-muramoylpentapeptide beta-N-acetylglucosaminyltransferase [Pisciglobus halotolerans]
MKVLVSGGGTGGHIYPALALLKQIKKEEPAAEFLYVGTERGLESRIVPEAKIPFRSIKVEGFKRSLTMDNVKTIVLFLKAIKKSKTIVKEFEPDVVIGTGGYVCAPVVYAATKLKIPTIIHEQNSVAGITNKFLARYASKVAVCFEEAKQEFSKYPEKIEFTGNPRAQEVSGISKTPVLNQFGLDPDMPTALIFGGSRGARAINETVANSLSMFKERNYQLLFVTGEVHYQQVKKDIKSVNKQIAIVPYITNMPEVFASVSLVVCRSGATTLAELTSLGLPSILIPSPYVTNDHQIRNAESLVNNGAAEMIKEEDLTAQSFLHKLDDLMTNTNKRSEMAQQAKKMGKPDAADQLIQVIKTLL